MRGETAALLAEQTEERISIHSPHARGDVAVRLFVQRRAEFQSTPLMRGETCPPCGRLAAAEHFNPLPSCEGRPSLQRIKMKSSKFQSTPLMRGETRGPRKPIYARMYISIHSPHARGDDGMEWIAAGKSISIHSPHARGDPHSLAYHLPRENFNPLPSCEGRLILPPILRAQFSISIHSPHARGDFTRVRLTKTGRYFNPLPSCEGRLRWISVSSGYTHFNPLPSCEGRQHKPPKIRLDSRQFIQQKHHSSFF